MRKFDTDSLKKEEKHDDRKVKRIVIIGICVAVVCVVCSGLALFFSSIALCNIYNMTSVSTIKSAGDVLDSDLGNLLGGAIGCGWRLRLVILISVHGLQLSE